jgi:hypothetical protein
VHFFAHRGYPFGTFGGKECRKYTSVSVKLLVFSLLLIGRGIAIVIPGTSEPGVLRKWLPGRQRHPFQEAQMKASLVWFLRLSAVLILLGCAQNVYASTFDFTFSGSGISASGTLTATLVSGDQFLVTSLSGMQNGMSMTLLAPGTFGMNDNELFSSAPYLDLQGIGFSIGSVDYAIYYSAGLDEYFECNNSGSSSCPEGSGTQIQFGSLMATPEPGSLLLLGTGLLGLAPLLRRRFVRA